MTTIRVDEELLTKTNDLGVNFSKIDELLWKTRLSA